MPTGDILQCEMETGHAQKEGWNSCGCGFRKYPPPGQREHEHVFPLDHPDYAVCPECEIPPLRDYHPPVLSGEREHDHIFPPADDESRCSVCGVTAFAAGLLDGEARDNTDITAAVYDKARRVDDDKSQRLIQAAGMRLATLYDSPTHAICSHGEIVEINVDSHICGWKKLVAEAKREGEAAPHSSDPVSPDNAYIVASKEDGGWRGWLMVNRRTPSGCDRWMPQVSTKILYEDRRQAEMALSGQFDAISIFDPDTQSYWGGRSVLAPESIAAPTAGAETHATELTEVLKERTTFQERVDPWLIQCFGVEIARNAEERNHRFLEESLELVQACGCTQSEAYQLVNYVFGRPVGKPHQEVGGVMVTLAALCLAHSCLDMHAAGEAELARVWTKIEVIRAKQAGKPKHSPLPQSPAATHGAACCIEGLNKEHKETHPTCGAACIYCVVCCQNASQSPAVRSFNPTGDPLGAGLCVEGDGKGPNDPIHDIEGSQSRAVPLCAGLEHGTKESCSGCCTSTVHHTCGLLPCAIEHVPLHEFSPGVGIDADTCLEPIHEARAICGRPRDSNVHAVPLCAKCGHNDLNERGVCTHWLFDAVSDRGGSICGHRCESSPVAPPKHCPTCNSPNPHLHPALAFEGEVSICKDEFHLWNTPENIQPAAVDAVVEVAATSDLIDRNAVVIAIDRLAVVIGPTGVAGYEERCAHNDGVREAQEIVEAAPSVVPTPPSAVAGERKTQGSFVALEGRLDLERIRDAECHHQFLTGLALGETGASNIVNVEYDLEHLNGKYVRVTIAWSETPLAATTPADPTAVEMAQGFCEQFNLSDHAKTQLAVIMQRYRREEGPDCPVCSDTGKPNIFHRIAAAKRGATTADPRDAVWERATAKQIVDMVSDFDGLNHTLNEYDTLEREIIAALAAEREKEQ